LYGAALHQRLGEWHSSPTLDRQAEYDDRDFGQKEATFSHDFFKVTIAESVTQVGLRGDPGAPK
jgi:hypothetical protein